jgi:molybdenum cofactor cytidylyltransferase
MKFASFPTAEAEGAILAHGIAAPGIGFKKGRILSAADVTALQAANVASVMAARLESGDVGEDDAARRIGQALRGHHTTLSSATTGRTNVYAAEAGLVTLDAARIDAINAVHESITIATLAPFERVEPRQMLATVKIIPFAAPDWAVKRVEELASPRPIAVAPFRPRSMALISTALPGMKASLLDKNRAVLAARAESLGSRIASENRCAHETDAVSAALKESLSSEPDLVLVFGASATTDRADAVPAGIAAAGGTIEHFGMPVDPGNLLLLARIGTTAVIGLPGCARSPKLNGFDFVLQRLCAGIPVTPSAIAAMGVGGLLKEIPTRPQPRDRQLAKPQRVPKIAAIVLAAGKSTRMGGTNKLLMNLHGKPMVARTVANIAKSAAQPIIVVTGNDGEKIGHALQGLPVSFAANPRYAEGLSTSLKAGLAALPEGIDGVLVCLADMPAVTPAAIAKLVAAFNPVEGRAIVVPVFEGKRGNPVLFAEAYVAEMRGADGDTGARALLSAHAEAVYEVEMDDAGVLADADTPAAFAAIEAGFKE